MEQKDRRVEDVIRVFSALIKQSISSGFKISRGGQSVSTLESWVSAMEQEYGSLSKERIVDYCVCQAYQMSRQMEEADLKKWKTHLTFSPNGKAWNRYKESDKRIKYYEDKWLSEIGLNRQKLLSLIKDRSKHPLSGLIITDYEELTKSRNLGTDVGYYICEKQTLLYTPFSKSCQQCALSSECIERTQAIYPELYRVRKEAWEQSQTS